MQKRMRALSLCGVGGLIIGLICGIIYSNVSFHQKSVSRLDNGDLFSFANTLVAAENDIRKSTSNPTTPLEKAYEVNLKVDVGQLSVLWGAMSQELIAQGLPSVDVQQIGSELDIIDKNILPPYGMMEQSASVQRARAWITFFYNAMYPGNKLPNSNAIYFSRLKSNISSIFSKYRSYKSDPNFQIGPL